MHIKPRCSLTRLSPGVKREGTSYSDSRIRLQLMHDLSRQVGKEIIRFIGCSMDTCVSMSCQILTLMNWNRCVVLHNMQLCNRNRRYILISICF